MASSDISNMQHPNNHNSTNGSQPAGFFQRIRQVKSQLKIIVFLTVVSFVFLGYKGVSGMQEAAASIENLYSKGMQNTMRAGKVLDELGKARSSLLLAFQHDPSSKFANMHSHPLDLHIQAAESSLKLLHHIIDNVIMGSSLEENERD